MPELTLEELIELAIQEDKKTKKRKLNSRQNRAVLRFIQKFSIGRGNIRVPTCHITRRYNTWANANDYPRYTNIEIGRVFSQYFTKGKSGKYGYYYLNTDLDGNKKEFKLSKSYYHTYVKKKKDQISKP